MRGKKNTFFVQRKFFGEKDPSLKRPIKGQKFFFGLIKSPPYLGSRVFFLIKFFLIFSVSNVLIYSANLTFLTDFIARTAGGFLNMGVVGSSIFTNAGVFFVSNSCTGLVSASVLGSIIFALRKPGFGLKLILFIFGAFVLLFLNIPRVMLVLLSAKWGFDAGLVHELTWFLMSAVILLIWYFGTKALTGVKDFGRLI